MYGPPGIPVNARPARVCVCKGIAKEDIKNYIFNEGIDTLQKLIKKTDITTGCGTCVKEVNRIFDKYYEEYQHQQFTKNFSFPDKLR